MRLFALARATALGAALCTLGACYSYTALPPSGARIGERVRVRVSGTEAERLEPALGLTERAIEGELLDQADSSIALAVALPTPGEGAGRAERARQRIVIPRADLQDIELRRLDKLRTWLLVGSAVVAVAAIAATKGSTLLGSGNSSGTPNERRMPRAIPLAKWSLTIP